MTKKPQTVEALLKSGKNVQMSESEREEMKLSVLSYAEFHGAHKNTASQKRHRGWMYAWAAASTLLVLMVVGTGIASNESLPDEPLYLVKVDVVEPLLGLSRFDPNDRLEYEAALIDRRLSELHQLSKLNRLTEDTATDLESQVSEHSVEILTLVADEKVSQVEPETKLDTLSEVVTSLRTQHYITRSTLGHTRSSSLDETEEEVQTVYDEEAGEFVEEHPEEAAEYMREVLEEVNLSLSKSTVASTSPHEISDLFTDVQEALTDGNIERALQYVGEVQQHVEFNENVEAFIKEESSEAAADE